MSQLPDTSVDFLKAFLAINKRLSLFISALLPCQADADEVFQRTGLILLEQWAKFDQSRSFFAWACGIARIQAKRYLAEQGRQGHLLGDAVSLLVEEAVERTSGQVDDRLHALKQCLQRLSTEHRDLLTQCYSRRRKLQEVASDLRMTPNALSLRLRRLREVLHQCVDGSLTRGAT